MTLNFKSSEVNKPETTPSQASFSQPRSILANASWNVFSTIWSMATIFFLAPFLIHRIGEIYYGLFILLASISGLLGIINLGLGEATLRFVSYYYSEKDYAGINRVFGASLFVYAIMGSLASLGLFFGAKWCINLLHLSSLDNDLVIKLIRITSITFCLQFLSGPFFALPQAMLRYDISSRLTIIESILRVIGYVSVIMIGFGIYGLIFWNCVIAAFFLIATIIISKKLNPYLRILSLPNIEGFKEIFSYGIFAFLSQFVGIAWQYTDRMLLGVFVGTSAIAHFAVPQGVTFRFLGLASSASSVLLPKFSSLKDPKALQSLYLHSTSVLLFFTIVIFVPMAVLFKDFISLWISPQFANQSAFLGSIIAASCIVRGAFLPYETLFKGIGKPQYYLVVIFLSSSTILIADFILIPAYGLAGAGYAYCISPLWGLLSILFAYRYILKMKNWFYLFKVIYMPMLLGFVCLGTALWLRSLFSINLGWFDLLLWGGSIMSLTALVLFLYEIISGNENSTLDLIISLVKNAKFGEIWTK